MALSDQSGMASGNLLKRLLERGDDVEVLGGQLKISPASGEPVPSEWLAGHQRQIQVELAGVLGIPLFRYVGYTVGNYGCHRASGITLRFEVFPDYIPGYCVFNVDLARARNTKNGAAGNPLPDGQFRPRPGGEFVKFWNRTGIKHPDRRGKYHQHMGNLKHIIFTGEILDEKIKKSTLAPLTISADDLRDIFRTYEGQYRDNEGTNPKDKKMQTGQQRRTLQASSTTGQSDHGNTEISKEGVKVFQIICSRCAGEGCPWCKGKTNIKPPQDQSTEEWLSDFIGEGA